MGEVAVPGGRVDNPRRGTPRRRRHPSRGARGAGPARRDPRRRGADLRRARRRAEPHGAHALPALGVAPPRPRRVVGRDLARGDADLRRARQARRGVHAGQRAPRRRRGRGGRRVREAAAARRRRRARARWPRGGTSPRSPTPSCSPRPTRASADDVVTPGDSTSATRTSSSSRAGAPVARRASCSRTARASCASFPNLLTDHDGGTVCMFPLFHMAGWSMTLNAWQSGCPVHLVATARRRHRSSSTVDRRRATRLYCIPAVWNRVLEHDRSRLRPVGSPRGRHRDLGDAARARSPRSRTRSPTRSRGSTTGRPRPGPATLLGDADLARKPGSVGLPPPTVVAATDDDGEVCVHSEFLMDGYFEQPEATAEALRRARARRAGTTPAISARSTTRATCRSSDARATCCAPAARRSRPARSRPSLADHPAIAEVAVVGIPDARVGRDRVRGRRRSPRARGGADARRAARALRRPARPVQAARGASRSSTRSRAPRRPARSSARCSSSA